MAKATSLAPRAGMSAAGVLVAAAAGLSALLAVEYLDFTLLGRTQHPARDSGTYLSWMGGELRAAWESFFIAACVSVLPRAGLRRDVAFGVLSALIPATV